MMPNNQSSLDMTCSPYTSYTASFGMDMFEKLFELQTEFGKKFNNFSRIRKSKYKRQTKTMEFIDHTIEELVEMRRELPIRKDWSKRKKTEPKWENVLEEYVDALHFFISIALVNGWTAQQVFEAYLNKNHTNHDRLKEGY